MPQEILCQEVIDTINHLIQISLDYEKSCLDAVSHTQDTHIQTILMQQAQRCKIAAQELQQGMQQHHQPSQDTGSLQGTLQRGWHMMSAAFKDEDPHTFLVQCEQAAQKLYQAYLQAYDKDDLPQDLNLSVKKHLEEAQAHIHLVQDLCASHAGQNTA